ncbi:MAG: immunity 22 family protein [Planctomycetota bacterium]
MPSVHVFTCGARFESFKAMRAFVTVYYDDLGDPILPPFQREVEVAHYEPMAIEAVHSAEPQPLRELLARTSYAEQWLPALPEDAEASQAFCVFAPNQLRDPEASSLDYVGAFAYRP